MSRKIQNKIIVLATSKAWSSTISRNFDRGKLSWVLDLDSLEREIFKFQSAAAIIEIPRKGQAEFFPRIAELSNNSQFVQLFAVASSLAGLERLIHVTGFAQAFSSPLEVPRLIKAIMLHEQSVPEKFQTLEASIKSNLPWTTAAID